MTESGALVCCSVFHLNLSNRGRRSAVCLPEGTYYCNRHFFFISDGRRGLSSGIYCRITLASVPFFIFLFPLVDWNCSCASSCCSRSVQTRIPLLHTAAVDIILMRRGHLENSARLLISRPSTARCCCVHCCFCWWAYFHRRCSWSCSPRFFPGKPPTAAAGRALYGTAAASSAAANGQLGWFASDEARKDRPSCSVSWRELRGHSPPPRSEHARALSGLAGLLVFARIQTGFAHSERGVRTR